MSYASAIASAWGFSRSRLLVFLSVVLAGSLVLGVFAAAFKPTGSDFSFWWPAAGLNVVAALSVRRRHRVSVLAAIYVVTLVASLTAPGRPVSVSIVLSLGAVIETSIVVALMQRRDEEPRLEDTKDALRFFGASAAGAIAIGLFSGLTVVFLLPDSSFLGSLASVAASHFSAVLVIAPLALVRRPRRAEISVSERVFHFALVVVVVGLVFSPWTSWPIAFIPLPFLVWGALRYSMLFVAGEMLTTAVIAALWTVAGGGPFGHGAFEPDVAGVLVEIFLVTYAGCVIFLAASHTERDRLEEQRLARSRVLREGVVATRAGFLMIEEDIGRLWLLEGNVAAAELLEDPRMSFVDGAVQRAVVDDMYVAAPIRAMLAQGLQTWSGDLTVGVEEPRELALTVTRTRGFTRGELFTVEIVDVTAQREREMVQRALLARERDMTVGLRELNQQKDDFVSSVSHELRTPISSILGFAEELQESALDEEQKDYVGIILRNSGRLAEMLEDLLALSRLGAGAARAPATDPVDLNDAIATVLRDLTFSAEEKGVTIAEELGAGPFRVLAYPSDLSRVLANVLTNALKFTPSGGAVSVTTEQMDGGVLLKITDSGSGIPPAELEKVFDRFYRTPGALRDSVPGTGLGLPIVRGLVEQFGGTVRLESDGVHGTTAVLVFPVVG